MKLMGQVLRAILLVAVVVAAVTSTGLLIETVSNGQATGSQSNQTLIDEEIADLKAEDEALALAGASAIDDLNDDPSVLIDSTEGDRPSPADKAGAPADESSPSTVELVAVESAATASLETLSAEAQGAATYRKVEMANLTYGQGAANLGLVAGTDKRPTGPVSFAVDKSGNVFVSDNVNGRVQVFSASGKHLRSFPVEASAYDLTLAENGELYLLGEDGKLRVHDSNTGKQKAKWSLNAKAAEELGKLRAAGGEIVLESPHQKAYPVAKTTGASGQAVPVADQVARQKQGAKTTAASFFSTTYRDGGHLYRLNEQGKTVQDIALKVPQVATVIFLAEDKSGSLYVQVEKLGSGGLVSVEVRQYNKKGELTAIVPISRIDYIQMTRSAVVTENGEIYQLLPTRQGVSLVKWQRS